MTVIGEAFVAVRPDSSGFGSAAEKDILGPIKGIAAAAAGLFAGVFAGKALIANIKEVTSAWQDQAQVTRLSEAVIKSTGGVANVTADQMAHLADVQSKLTGIEDDQIQHAENVLATFTAVRNEVGKGNDIFDQATIAAENLSAALGQDLQSSSVQIGKALNDPIAGVTALRRVGVQLTQQQQDQVAAFVASNDILSAQKVILGELTTEFGGAAQAAADPLKRLQATIKEAKETVGAAVFPLVATVADSLGEAIPGIGETIAAAITKSGFADFLPPLINSVLGTLQAVVGAVAPVVSSLTAALAPAFAAVTGIVQALVPAIAPVGKLAGTIITSIAQVVSALAPLLVPIATLIGIVADAFSAGLVPAVVAVTNAIAPVVAAILPALNAVLVVLAPLITQMATTFGTILAQAVTAVAPFLLQLAPIFSRIAGAVGLFLQSVGSAVFGAFVAVLQAIIRAATPLLPVIVRLAELFANELAAVLVEIAPVLSDLAATLGGALATAITNLAPILPPLVEAMGQFLLIALPLLPPLVEIVAALLELAAPLLTCKPLIDAIVLAFIAWKLVLGGAWLVGFAVALVTEVVPAVIGYIGTMITAAAATIAATWPVLAIIGAVALLAAGIFLLVDNFGAVVDWIKSHWTDILGVLLLGPVWFFRDTIGGVIGDAVQFFLDLPGKVISALSGLPGQLFGIGGDIVEGLVGGLRALLHKVGEVVGDIIDKLNPLKHIPGGGVVGGALNAIGLAGGGRISGPAIVGEIGPELFWPDTAGQIITNADLVAGLRAAFGSSQPSGNPTSSRSLSVGQIVVPVAHSPEDAALATVGALQSLMFGAGV